MIDGQQRLTSLYAVFSGHPIITKEGKSDQIILSFNPLTAEFKVADASTEKGYDWIYDIKTVLSGNNLFNLTSEYVLSYRERNESNPDTEKTIADNIQNLFNL